MTKAIIFDFDGTIADSFSLFVETLHKLLGKSHALSPELITQLRGKQIKEITAELGIKRWQLPRFVMKGRKEISNNFHDVRAFKGIDDLIKVLSKTYKLYILSTNSKVVISKFLKDNQLEEYFVEIYADIGLTGKSKYLKRLIKDHHYDAKDALYIGDEVRDIEAAHRAGLTCISVSWGYSTEESLKVHNPDFLALNTQEVLDAVAGF